MFFRGKQENVADSANSPDDALMLLGIKHNADPIFVVVDGALTACNPAAVRLFGARSRDELIGRKMSDFTASRQPGGLTGAESMKAVISVYTRDGYARTELQLRRPDGKEFPARFVISQIPDQPKRTGLVIIEDISSWKSVQARIEAAAVALADDGTVGAVARELSGSAGAMAGESQAMNANAATMREKLAAVAEMARHSDDGARAMATSSDSLSSAVASVRSRIEERERTTGNAVNEAEKASAIVSTLSDAAQRIDDVVQLINNIAGQTNLLALNATIEAARAGEAGKGFAVVAAEVKNLANQTAKATGDIQAQVASVQAAAASAVEAIGGISRTIGLVSADSQEIARTVEDQASSTTAIVRSSNEMLRLSQALSASLSQIFDAVSENQQRAGRLNERSGDIKLQADKLQEEVRRFKIVHN